MVACICQECLCTPGVIVCWNVYEIFLYNDCQRRNLGSWCISRHRIKYWGYLAGRRVLKLLGILLVFFFDTLVRMNCKNAPLSFAAPCCPPNRLSAIFVSTRQLVTWISRNSIHWSSANVCWCRAISVTIGKHWQTYRHTDIQTSARLYLRLVLSCLCRNEKYCDKNEEEISLHSTYLIGLFIQYLLLIRITGCHNNETYIRVIKPCNHVGLITCYHNEVECSSWYGKFPSYV
jgi:hypothetical protein